VLSTLRQAKAYSDRGYHVEDIVSGCKEELNELLERISSEGLRRIIRKLQ
jgi:hypothetical protein